VLVLPSFAAKPNADRLRWKAEALKRYRALDEATRAQVNEVAKHPVEQCGLCGGLRADEDGLHCRLALRPRDYCGKDCGPVFLVAPVKGLPNDEDSLDRLVTEAQASRGFYYHDMLGSKACKQRR
jgi:hypothetical protein